MYTIAIYTLGCKLNQFESESIAGSFKKAGFPLIQDSPLPGPGIIIINTCTVTSKADQKCRRLIRKALRDNQDSCVIVTGCYAHLDTCEIASLENEITAGLPGIRRLFVLGGGEGASNAAGTVKSALLDLPEYLLKTADLPGGSLPAILESWMESAGGGGRLLLSRKRLPFIRVAI